MVRRPDPVPTIEEIVELLAEHDVTHVGVTDASILASTRSALHERRDAGLHADMGFTYRDPDRSTDPGRAVAGARSVIVAARPYLTDTDPPTAGPGDGPQARVGRYAWVDHYAPLRVALRSAAQRIRAADHRAVAFADDNSIVDRAVAYRAGLGWYGKNANLLLPGAGSWFVLGCIVTTVEYEPARQPVADGCGSCTRCVDACPTGAIVADGVIDANRCLTWVMQRPGSIPTEYRAAIGDRIYGCDDCQDACPISVRLGPRSTIHRPADVDGRLDVVELLEADDDWIEQRCGHWYIADRDLRWIRRNALVVLGNVAAGDDTRAGAIVERYRDGIDPVLAEHAVWASERIAERRAADAT